MVGGKKRAATVNIPLLKRPIFNFFCFSDIFYHFFKPKLKGKLVRRENFIQFDQKFNFLLF
jgi:hypothetical protein